MPRGGARPGAGRPPAPEPGEPVQTWLRRSLLERVDAAAREAGISRSAWIAEAVRRRLRRGRAA